LARGVRTGYNQARVAVSVHSGIFVVRIWEAPSPADLPVEQRFENTAIPRAKIS